MDKKKQKDILWFQEVNKNDIDLVGGKGANLGEMAAAGFPIPQGFIVTSKAYFDFIEENKLKSKIHQELKKSILTTRKQLMKLLKRLRLSFYLGKFLQL